MIEIERCCLQYCGFHRVKDMYNHVSERSGLKAPLISDEVYEIIMKVLLPFLNIILCRVMMRLKVCLFIT